MTHDCVLRNHRARAVEDNFRAIEVIIKPVLTQLPIDVLKVATAYRIPGNEQWLQFIPGTGVPLVVNFHQPWVVVDFQPCPGCDSTYLQLRSPLRSLPVDEAQLIARYPKPPLGL